MGDLREQGGLWGCKQSPVSEPVSESSLGTDWDLGHVRPLLRGDRLMGDFCLGFALWDAWLLWD